LLLGEHFVIDCGRKFETIRKSDANYIGVRALTPSTVRVQDEVWERQEAVQSEVPLCEFFSSIHTVKPSA